MVTSICSGLCSRIHVMFFLFCQPSKKPTFQPASPRGSGVGADGLDAAGELHFAAGAGAPVLMGLGCLGGVVVLFASNGLKEAGTEGGAMSLIHNMDQSVSSQ